MTHVSHAYTFRPFAAKRTSACAPWLSGGGAPFDVAQSLALDDSFYELRVAEECDGEVTVQTLVHTSGENLMQKVVNDVMQEVIPRKFEEELLHETVRS